MEARRQLTTQAKQVDVPRRRNALALPRQGDLDALRDAEERSNLLWDGMIEFLAASFVAEDYLEWARALTGPDDPEPEVEAA